MSTLTIHVHGAEGPGDTRRARLERRIADQMRDLGYGRTAVRTYAWRSGSPVGSALALGSLALLGGGLLGLGARAAWAVASAGAVGGATASYRLGRGEARRAAQGLTRDLIAACEKHDRVHVVAHSLGTDVALRAVGALAAGKRTLPGVLVCAAGTARVDRDYSHVATATAEGVINLYNPFDVALLAEIPVRFADVVGRSPMQGAGITNVRTSLGHASQVSGFARVLERAGTTGAA